MRRCLFQRRQIFKTWFLSSSCSQSFYLSSLFFLPGVDCTSSICDLHLLCLSNLILQRRTWCLTGRGRYKKATCNVVLSLRTVRLLLPLTQPTIYLQPIFVISETLGKVKKRWSVAITFFWYTYLVHPYTYLYIPTYIRYTYVQTCKQMKQHRMRVGKRY